jgi:hypothetical protein
VKYAKKLSRVQKEFLSCKGLDTGIHMIIKNLPDFYEFYNKVTGVTFKYWR